MAELLVNIDVDDLQRAIAFYTGAFDLRIGRRLGTDAVELLGACAPIYLLVKARGTQPFANATQLRDYGRHWTPVHLDFVVRDIDNALRRAVAAGATVETPTRSSTWGKLALLADPFGNGLCLIEFVGRGYDEIATS
ncbi:MAG: VOC family protein [Burkholderiaceae bacterium]|jgi:predicted enzyme related to lactoylglutathione lyase|nr:VOC family protein [Burkholderiaceae bacterium]